MRLFPIISMISLMLILTFVSSSQPTKRELCLLICDVRYRPNGIILADYKESWLNCRDECFQIADFL